MLPNWLYGKSKSKLASILGGGGGTPADYNQVKAQVNQNTEDILLLNNALDDKAALTQITNPNLLDNPWFTVNQRGQSRYTKAEAYTVDRWKLRKTAAACTLSVTDDGITISAPDATDKTIFIAQYVEESFIKRLNGKAVTMSVLKNDGTILKGTIASFDYQTSAQFVNIGGFVLDYEVYNNKYSLRIHNWSQSDITIRAVKLELGSVSTLAMDTAPNYQQELAKCQRYFQRLTGVEDFLLGVAFVDTATRMDLTIATPALIRGTTPTVTLTGTLKIGFSTTTNVSGMSLIGMFSNILSLNLTSENMTPGTVKRISWGANSYIDISADL